MENSDQHDGEKSAVYRLWEIVSVASATGRMVLPAYQSSRRDEAFAKSLD